MSGRRLLDDDARGAYPLPDSVLSTPVELALSTAFAPAWLAGAPGALALLPDGFRRPEARRDAVRIAAERQTHPALLASLAADTAARRRHRDALARPGAAAVVTGQQAGLFGGPLYTVYKAAAAIADAAALERETGTPCAPVFWLQNEDHDLAEIASCRVLGSDGALHTVSIPDPPGDQRRSVSARKLGPAIGDALDALEEALRGLSAASETMALLRRCYTPETSPDAAFRALIDALFAEHGLLVVDPCDSALRDAARPVHERAVAESARIGARLHERAEALREAGFAVQVHVQPDSPLSFFHPDGPEGPRYRLSPTPDGRYRLRGTDRLLASEALPSGAWSTSALLRPILQDTWLPTAAYVGGPGELAYFAQLPPLYESFGLPMPLAVPRARFRVLDETTARLLAQLDLDPDALSEPREALLRRIATARGDEPDPEALERALVAPLREALDAFAPHARALDDALAKAADKTAATVTDAARRLADRYRSALARRDEVARDRLDRLLARLAPDGAPQERVHALPWYLARHGLDTFTEAVLRAVVPFDGTLRTLRP